MEKNIYSLRSNVGYFFNRPIGFSRDFEVNFEEIFLPPDLKVFHLQGTYRFTRNREGLLLQAELRGFVDATCSRCLQTCQSPFTSSFEELYLFPSRTTEESTEEIIPGDGYIDLGVPFRDYILLDLPIQPLCKEDCKGICTECGQNLNLGECEHGDKRIHF